MTEGSLFKNPSWHEARQIAYNAAATKKIISLPLADTEGKTLAKDLKTKHPLPPFNTAMMDGYAVKGAGPWKIIGEVLAGSQTKEIADNEAIYIATGAMVPASAELVVKHEVVEIKDQILYLLDKEQLIAGNHIRVIGDEGETGATVFSQGIRINPATIGLAAASGLDELEVFENPTVDFIVSGDELLTSGLPREGKIRDALSMQIPGWIKSVDASVGKNFSIKDDLNETIKAINECRADLILTTGGTAAGEVDFMHQALAQTGFELVIDEVKVRPGHPMFLAKNSKNQFLVGLPGNPLAAFVSFLTLAVPIIEKMQGRHLQDLESGTLTDSAYTSKKEMRLFPVKVNNGKVAPLQFWGSMMLRGLAASSHFAIIEAGKGSSGEAVELIRLPWKS